MPPFFIMWKVTFILLLVGFSAISQAADFYSIFNVESYSDAFPIYDVVQGLDDDMENGGYAFLSSKLESGVKFEYHHYGVLMRHETFLQTNKDTNDIIFRTETSRPIPSDKHYSVYVKANQMEAWGITGGFSFPIGTQIVLDVNVQLLNAEKMLDGTFRGGIDTFATDYQGKLFLDYYYTKDAVFDRPVHRKTGQGLSSDIHLQWKINDQHLLELTALDLINGIYWKDMYRTVADLTSNRINYDQNGQLDVRPALQGTESNKSHIQTLPTKYFMAWSYTINNDHKISSELVCIEQFKEARVRYLPAQLKGVYFYLSSHQAMGLGYSAKQFQVFLASDSLDYENTHTLLLQTSWNWFF